jgi:hypothetical protein
LLAGIPTGRAALKNWNAYLKQDEIWGPELSEDMVDLGVQLVGAVEGPPSLEDGMCDLQDSNVDGDVVCG